MFISLEGIDGSGKSTQARLLAQHLRGLGQEVVLTREPGGSTGAEQIRDLLVRGTGNRWSAETELLLFTAARRDHLEQVIWPALGAGKTVISDRFADSTRVYQGVVRGDLGPLVEDLHRLVIGIEPELTFLVDLPAPLALSRGLSRGGSESRYESMGLDFHERLRQGFLDLAGSEPGRFRVIDGRGDEAMVAARIRAALP